nr:unnamed protein product [Callosobruchus analis]
MELENREQHFKASFEIAFMIAKQKEPHTIDQELIKPCVLKPTQIILADVEINFDWNKLIELCTDGAPAPKACWLAFMN